MAGDWIKIEHATPDKPEVYAIAESLGLDPDHVVGALLRIWIWADQQLRDCNARGVTKTALDRKANVTGFADALISVGWMITTKDGIQFINFDKHNGKTAKSRALTVKRVETHRKRSCNDERVTKSLPEKRREENITPTPFEAPSQVDPQAWADLDAYRTGVDKKTWTEEAKKKNAALLAKYPAETQRDMVDLTIRNSWRGVFAPKGVKPAVADQFAGVVTA